MSIESKGENVFGCEKKQRGASEELHPMLGYTETDGGQREKQMLLRKLWIARCDFFIEKKGLEWIKYTVLGKFSMVIERI